MIRMDFRINIPAVAGRLKKKVLLSQKKIAFDVLSGVVSMTPVDKGRAKGNWFISLGAPRVDYEWGRLDPSGNETISAGTQVIDQLQDYGAIYLTNNLPYILPLEKGHSRQAPAGMVRLSLDRVAAGLR